jgi:hypothetical protein
MRKIVAATAFLVAAAVAGPALAECYGATHTAKTSGSSTQTAQTNPSTPVATTDRNGG